MIDASLKRIIESSLEKTPPEVWNGAKRQSNESKYRKREWWHNKYYKRRSPDEANNGFTEQEDEWGNIEIPYKREIFYPSPNGRFSLGKGKPVAYFSADFATNCCETVFQFRTNSKLSWDRDLSEYLAGKSDPHPEWTGYPRNYRITDDSQILDISKKSNALLNYLHSCTQPHRLDIFDEVIINRDPTTYPITQKIAIVSKANGFDGIIFKSVRVPKDIILPSKNLVMFNPTKITRWKSNRAP